MKELTKEQITWWCEGNLPRGKWKLNSQGRVDVEGDVHIINSEFQKFPVTFGEVSGDFYCSGCTSLTSLEGAPQVVTGDFSCSGCTSLTSLEGAPQVVTGSFRCYSCTSLTTLKGAPQFTGSFICNGSSLTTLEGAPHEITGFFDCSGCTSLTSLEGAPQVVTGSFYCNTCTSLDPLHSEIINDYEGDILDWPTAHRFIHRPKLAKAHALGLI
jgi:hypothetical protein